jgi:hypothetical protein
MRDSEPRNDAAAKEPASIPSATTSAAAGNACPTARRCYGHGIPEPDAYGKHDTSTSTTAAGLKKRADRTGLPRQSSSTLAAAAAADGSRRSTTSGYGTSPSSSSAAPTTNATAAAPTAPTATGNCHAACSITIK